MKKSKQKTLMPNLLDKKLFIKTRKVDLEKNRRKNFIKKVSKNFNAEF